MKQRWNPVWPQVNAFTQTGTQEVCVLGLATLLVTMQQRDSLFSYLPLRGSVVPASPSVTVWSSTAAESVTELRKKQKKYQQIWFQFVYRLKSQKGEKKSSLSIHLKKINKNLRDTAKVKGLRLRYSQNSALCIQATNSNVCFFHFPLVHLDMSAARSGRKRKVFFLLNVVFFLVFWGFLFMTEVPLCADRGCFPEAGQRHWWLLKVKKKAGWHRRRHQLHSNNGIMSSSQHFTTHSSKPTSFLRPVLYLPSPIFTFLLN